MADSTFPTDRPHDSVCPWCSASLAQEAATCQSCGAILISDEEPDLPGVTAIDQAVVRGEKKPASRSRLLSWISGDYQDDTPSVSESHALAPPDPAVQREMIRLSLEAEVANLQAEADSLLSEAVVEGRLSELPESIRPLATGEFSGEPIPTDAGAVTEGVASEPTSVATGASTAESSTGEAVATPSVDADPPLEAPKRSSRLPRRQ